MAVRNSSVQLGILTVNEARAQMGLPPVAWGDERYSVKTSQTITTDDLDKGNA
jgi:hypothetical protein